MLAVFAVLGIGSTIQEMPAPPAGNDLDYQIGYQIGSGLVFGILAMFVVAALLLLLGGVYYVTSRKKGVTFREAVFNWPLVILAGLVAFLSLL